LTSFNTPSPGRIRIAEETAEAPSSEKSTMGLSIRRPIATQHRLAPFSGRNRCVGVAVPLRSSAIPGNWRQHRRFQLKANHGGKGMFHILWYVIIGLLSGLIAKSVMHEHLTMFWTIVLGIVGSILGGGLTHMISRSKNERFHPAGLIFSTLGAILVLFICYKLKIHLP
jgi:uncharacterized membrane protein YeaQ/YmgE (transglycosylase-associated protein family)